MSDKDREPDTDELRQGFERYEKVRMLNPRQFHELWVRALETGEAFDLLVDELE